MGRERSGNSLKPSGAPVVQPSGIYAGITFPAITILLLRALDNPTQTRVYQGKVSLSEWETSLILNFSPINPNNLKET